MIGDADSQNAPATTVERSDQLPRILVIDDEKNMRLSLKTVLEDERYSVLILMKEKATLQQPPHLWSASRTRLPNRVGRRRGTPIGNRTWSREQFKGSRRSWIPRTIKCLIYV